MQRAPMEQQAHLASQRLAAQARQRRHGALLRRGLAPAPAPPHHVHAHAHQHRHASRHARHGAGDGGSV